MRSFFEGGYPETGGRAAFAPVWADYTEDVVLSADTLLRVAIPAGARFVVFSFNGDFRAKLGTAATTISLPGASTADGSGSELNPGARRVPAKLGDGTTTPTHICLRAHGTCEGSLVFYG